MTTSQYIRADIIIATIVMVVAALYLWGWDDKHPPSGTPNYIDLTMEKDQMPILLSELIDFATGCRDQYGDIPVFIRIEGDDEDLYTSEEMRLVRDPQTKQSAFVIADYELGEEAIKPRLSLVNPDNGII